MDIVVEFFEFIKGRYLNYVRLSLPHLYNLSALLSAYVQHPLPKCGRNLSIPPKILVGFAIAVANAANSYYTLVIDQSTLLTLTSTDSAEVNYRSRRVLTCKILLGLWIALAVFAVLYFLYRLRRCVQLWHQQQQQQHQHQPQPQQQQQQQQPQLNWDNWVSHISPLGRVNA